MKTTHILLCLILLPCLAISQQTINASIQHGGLTRDYILYVPALYEEGTPVALLFNFHGYTSNATQQMFYGDFRPIADTAGFIIVHPQGSLDGLGITHFNVGWGGSTVDDVGFTAALLDTISSQYSIDATRVYSTGMSNGGFMSYELACQLSERIAAVASVTGSMSPATYNNCDPQHPMPILEIHGTADPTVSYTGSAIARSVDDVMSYWVSYNQCEVSPTSTALPDLNTGDGSTVTQLIWAAGDLGVRVEHLRIENGGHRWPGSVVNQPGTNYDIDASLEVWKFFSRFDINGLIDENSEVLNVHHELAQVQVYPSLVADYLKIERQLDHPVSFEIWSAAGVPMMQGKLQSSTAEIDVLGLNRGVYFLKIENQSFKLFKL
jgi:polyhydroxybutyrate depolymerase